MPSFFPLGEKTSLLFIILYAVNILLGFAVVFLERKSPSATLAWLMVLFVFPGVGALLYLILSQNLSRYRITHRSTYEEERFTNALRSQISDMENGIYRFKDSDFSRWEQLIRMDQEYGFSYFTQDNSVEFITDGTELFDRMISDIDSAWNSIDMEYFIVKPDETGKRVIDALTRAAKRGIEVRLLLDALGSLYMQGGALRELEAAGGKVSWFLPARVFRIRWEVNYRNHRKICVIDSRIGYTGGFNIADEYTGRSKKFGGWRDTHVRLEGGCIEDLDQRFVMDWRFASKEPFSVNPYEYHSAVEKGNVGIQILSSGPDDPDRNQIEMAYLKMISSARKSIIIQSPYFIPGDSIKNALKNAALSGVDVSIMIPNRPDHIFVYWVTYSNVGDLLSSGVKVYVYDKGFLHSKMMSVDGEVSSVGSANFDIRSFKLNFESSAIIYGSSAARELERAFERDIEDSFRLTERIYRNRSAWTKFKECISRLVSDIL